MARIKGQTTNRAQDSRRSRIRVTEPTVRQPIEAMGRAAVALLVNQMDNVSGYPQELLFEPELVVRGSTAPVRTIPAAPPSATGPRP